MSPCAPHRFIKDDYLQQNSFTKYDKYCPFYKSVEMMRNISTFHRLATAAIEKTAGGNAEGAKITLNVIKQRMGDTLYKVRRHARVVQLPASLHCLPTLDVPQATACAVIASWRRGPFQ